MHFTSTQSQPLTIDAIARYAPSALAQNPHESRSARYSYIPTLEVIKGMESAGFMPFKASQSSARDASRREFTKHMIRFRQANYRDLAVGDVFPEVVMVNSHDGTSAYKFFAGLFRLRCLNGMCIAESTQASITVLHKGSVVEDAVNASILIAGDSQKALGRVREWSQIQLNRDEQHALATSAHILRFADSEGKVNTPITPEQLLHIRRTDDRADDLWTTFNRVQENVIKGGLSARTASGYDERGRYQRGRRVSTREVKGIDQDVKLNRALWTLAERMAELKASAV